MLYVYLRHRPSQDGRLRDVMWVSLYGNNAGNVRSKTTTLPSPLLWTVKYYTRYADAIKIILLAVMFGLRKSKDPTRIVSATLKCCSHIVWNFTRNVLQSTAYLTLLIVFHAHHKGLMNKIVNKHVRRRSHIHMTTRLRT